MLSRLPRSDRGIVTLLGQNYNGVTKYGAVIPVTLVTKAELLAAKNTLQDAAADFQAKRDELRASYELFHPGMEALQKWLVTTRAVLACSLGAGWSAAWAAAGFINNTTAVPKDNLSRIALASALEFYLTNNPDEERADMEVTAEMAGMIAETMLGLEAEVTDAKEALQAASAQRLPARATALSLIGSLVANLKRKLAPDDPRWIAFGFNTPAARRAPAAPRDVSVTADGAGGAVVQCPPVARATRYRCRMMVVGFDTKYRLVWSGAEPMGRIGTVAPGVTIQLTMEAVNVTAQSVPSEPVVFTMPPAVDALAQRTSPATLRNGNRT